MKHIVILGGGISGLTAAYDLARWKDQSGKPVEISLLESSDRLGGVIESVRGDGFVAEGGPDCFISEKPAALELCRELGLESDVIGTSPENQRSFVFYRGKLFPIPEGFYLVAPVRPRSLLELPFISWPGKFRMALEPFLPPRKSPGDESIGNFIRRRFGDETFLKVGQPMMSAMYGGDVDRLSLEAAFPRFKLLEEKYGSIVRALRKIKAGSSQAERTASGPRYSLFLTLKNGLEALPELLVKKMSGQVRLHLRAEAVSAARGEKGWDIRLKDGRRMEAEGLCVALPAPAAARLFEAGLPGLARQLGEIEYESVVTVSMIFRRGDIPSQLAGFGFVVPALEKRRAIGCTFSTWKFPGRTREDLFGLRLFLGGYQNPGFHELSDDVIDKLSLEELKVMTGIGATPVVTCIRRYPASMPQYHVGHLGRVTAIEKTAEKYPGLFLTGNAYRGLGVPDCIRQAREAARKITGLLS
ncbi:MAG: protoporphyrinogen oxidase [Candidatus Omnitrophota bacterium]|jgi:oxygen-dependent protoporphyrinogen oxidase